MKKKDLPLLDHLKELRVRLIRSFIGVIVVFLPLIFIKGKISNQGEEISVNQIIANKIFVLANLRKQIVKYINIKVDYGVNDQKIIEKLYDLCTKNKGDCSLILHFITAKKSSQRILIDKYSLDSNSDVLQKLRLIFGYQNVWIR